MKPKVEGWAGNEGASPWRSQVRLGLRRRTWRRGSQPEGRDRYCCRLVRRRGSQPRWRLGGPLTRDGGPTAPQHGRFGLGLASWGG